MKYHEFVNMAFNCGHFTVEGDNQVARMFSDAIIQELDR